MLLLSLGTHISIIPLLLRLRRVTLLLQHWDSSRLIAEMHFPFFVCHYEVMQLLLLLFMPERSYLNDMVGFPQGQRVWGSVTAIWKVEIQPLEGALIVETHHHQHLSWLEPTATRFSEQPDLPQLCRDHANTTKEVLMSWVHFSKLSTPAKNPSLRNNLVSSDTEVPARARFLLGRESQWQSILPS